MEIIPDCVYLFGNGENVLRFSDQKEACNIAVFSSIDLILKYGLYGLYIIEKIRTIIVIFEAVEKIWTIT